MFASWANFYTLLGEASASLIGLLFVVVTLTARMERGRVTNGVALFLTPVVFKFATVLAISAAALTPSLPEPAQRALVLLVAAIGALNLGLVARGLFRRKGLADPLHWSDPWCYGAAPTVIFLGVVGSALLPDPVAAARGVGIASVALLLLSVRNAWDLVTALAERVREGPRREED